MDRASKRLLARFLVCPGQATLAGFSSVLEINEEAVSFAWTLTASSLSLSWVAGFSVLTVPPRCLSLSLGPPLPHYHLWWNASRPTAVYITRCPVFFVCFLSFLAISLVDRGSFGLPRLRDVRAESDWRPFASLRLPPIIPFPLSSRHAVSSALC